MHATSGRRLGQGHASDTVDRPPLRPARVHDIDHDALVHVLTHLQRRQIADWRWCDHSGYQHQVDQLAETKQAESEQPDQSRQRLASVEAVDPADAHNAQRPKNVSGTSGLRGVASSLRLVVTARTFRVTERRHDTPTSTLDPNAASVHPLVRAVRGSSDSAPAIPRSPCSWQRPSQLRIARISRMLPIRVIRGQIRLCAADARTVQPRSTRPIRKRRRNCHNVGPQSRRRGQPVMNAARRRIWWSSCPTSPHRATCDHPAGLSSLRRCSLAGLVDSARQIVE